MSPPWMAHLTDEEIEELAFGFKGDNLGPHARAGQIPLSDRMRRMRRLASAFITSLVFACHHGGTDTSVHEPPPPQRAQLCGLDGWCWNNPLPLGGQVNALWGSAWNDIWAGTRDGLLHFDGAAWTSVAVPGGASEVRVIWGSGAHDVWSAGDSVFHWDGKTWTAASGLPPLDDPNPTFFGIGGSGPKDVLLLVDTGNGKDERHRILRWDGSSWAVQYGPTDPSLSAVWSSGPGTAWAVGIDPSTERDQVLRLTNGTWAPISVPDADPLVGVWGTGPADVWAVGGISALHWNGNAWARVDVPSSVSYGLRSLSGSGPTDVWAGGAGVVLHWDGHAWSSVYGSNTDDRAVRALWSSGTRNSWAAGEAGLFLHEDGGGWKTFAQGTIEYLTSAFAFSATDAWAVGGHGVALHFDGRGWSQVSTSSSEPLYSVWGHDGNDVWIAGASGDCNGFILHWNGVAWTYSFGPASSTCMSSVWGTGPADVWAVGQGVLMHWDGAGWTRTGPTGDVARSVWASSATDVWVLQQSIIGGPNAPGSVYHYDGANWTLVATGSTAQLLAIAGTGPHDVWIVTDDNTTVMHWDGELWSAIPTGVTADGATMNAVWGTGPADAWLGGGGIPILHWDGNAWSAPDGAENRSVTGLTGAGALWAVGGDGIILGR
jgi:hypothetical protein